MAKSKVKIGRVLFTQEQIEARLDELAEEIETRYVGCELTLVAVLKGSLFFTADLARRLTMPVRVDIMEVSSYFDGTEPVEDATLSHYLVADVRDGHVLVVDDIIDTGSTLAGVVKLLKREKPKSLATCVFLSKKTRRRRKVRVDFCGFELKGPEFVVGYGLDYARRYRNLSYLAVLDGCEPAAAAKPAKKTSRRKKSTRKVKTGRSASKGKSTSKKRPVAPVSAGKAVGCSRPEKSTVLVSSAARLS